MTKYRLSTDILSSVVPIMNASSEEVDNLRLTVGDLRDAIDTMISTLQTNQRQLEDHSATITAMSRDLSTLQSQKGRKQRMEC